jgi:hypothetical protein
MPHGSGQKNWRMFTRTPCENGYTPSGSLLVYHNFPRFSTSRVVWFVRARYLRATKSLKTAGGFRELVQHDEPSCSDRLGAEATAPGHGSVSALSQAACSRIDRRVHARSWSIAQMAAIASQTTGRVWAKPAKAHMWKKDNPTRMQAKHTRMSTCMQHAITRGKQHASYTMQTYRADTKHTRTPAGDVRCLGLRPCARPARGA